MRTRVHDLHLLQRNGLLLTVLYPSVQSGCGARTWLVVVSSCAPMVPEAESLLHPGKSLVSGERPAAIQSDRPCSGPFRVICLLAQARILFHWYRRSPLSGRTRVGRGARLDAGQGRPA